MEAVVPAEELGARLGRFEIVRAIGRGSSGTVVEARDPVRGEAVALKILGRGDARAFGRFKHEFRTLADLDHPNLVRLHELFLEDGRLFFSMELLRGVGFLDWVRPGGTLDEARLRDAMRQLARGTAALHAFGKLHRDIKSSNAFVTEQGRVVLIDFGFALDAGGPTSLDVPGAVVGTPAYMSPEQVFGLQVGTASDWYSVGVVLYEALTGSPPFRARDPQALMRQRLSKEPPPPSAVVDGPVPADLEALCVSLLRRVGSARPDVGAIIASLGDRVPPAITRGLGPAASAPTLYGRERELENIERAIGAVGPSRPAVALLHGPPGIGKSTLLQHAAQHARAERLRVWTGRCYERESIPYKAFDGVIDALVEDLRASELPLTHLCEPAEVHALVRLFPALGRLTAVRDTSIAVPANPSPALRDRGYAALKRLLHRLAQDAPILIVIDDLQWCDADSIQLWAELVRAPDAPALALLAAYRTEATSPDAPFSRVLARANEAGPELTLLDLLLGPLDDTAMVSLARDRLAAREGDRPWLAAVLAREAEGSPLFLAELVEHAVAHPELLDSGHAEGGWAPPLDEVLRARLAHLDPTARTVLETIAIAGQRIEQGTVLRAALGEQATATALDVLRRNRLVVASGFRDSDWIEPAHARIRHHVLDGLDATRRRERHLALANAMARSAHAEPEALATHFARAGVADLAALHALYAGSLANEGLAFEAAAHWFELALAHLPEDDERRTAIETSLGHALASAGRGYEAAQVLLRAAARTDGPTRRELRRLAAHWLVYCGDVGSGRALLIDLLEDSGVSFPRSRAAAIGSLLALRARIRLRGLAFRERRAQDIPAEQLHRIDLCWALGLMLNGDPILGAGFLARHLLLALDAGEATRIAPALANEVVARLVSGRVTATQAMREVDAAAEVAARSGSAEAAAWVEFVRPVVEMTAGDWKGALEHSRGAARLLQEHAVGSGLPILTCEYVELWCRFQVGEWAALPALAHRLIAAGGRANPHRAGARDLLAFPVALANDDPERALALLGEDRAGDGSEASERGAPFRFAAHVFTRLYRGDTPGAWGHACEHRRRLERRTRFRPAIANSFHLWADSTAAIAQAATGDAAARRRSVRGAARLSRLPFLPATALATLVEAGTLAADGERGPAAERFGTAADALDGVHMHMHANVARHRRGRLLGGDEGERLVEAARASMRAVGIVDPDRIAAALAPIPGARPGQGAD